MKRHHAALSVEPFMKAGRHKIFYLIKLPLIFSPTYPQLVRAMDLLLRLWLINMNPQLRPAMSRQSFYLIKRFSIPAKIKGKRLSLPHWQVWNVLI